MWMVIEHMGGHTCVGFNPRRYESGITFGAIYLVHAWNGAPMRLMETTDIRDSEMDQLIIEVV